MSFKKALELMEAYEPRRLARGEYFDAIEGCHCAIGVAIPETSFCRGRSISALVEDAPAVGLMALGKISMSVHEATRLQRFNDEWNGPPEARYQAVLEFLRNEVAKEST